MWGEEYAPTIKFATIGTNFIARNFLLAAQEVYPPVKWTAIYSREKTTADKFVNQQQYDYPGVETVKRFWGDVEDMININRIQKHFNAVYISSPTSFHASHAYAFLTNGIHVLCEKPVCSNTKELQLLIDTSRGTGICFMEAMRSLKLPNFEILKRELDPLDKNGSVFEGYFCQRSSRIEGFLSTKILPNAFDINLSNGALMDIGCYAVYAAVALFGTPLKVRYQVYERIGENPDGTLTIVHEQIEKEKGADLDGTLTIVFKNNSTAKLRISKTQNNNPESTIRMKDGTIYYIDHLSEWKQVYRKRSGGDKIPIGVERIVNTEVSKDYIWPSMVKEIHDFCINIDQKRIQDSLLTHQLSLDVMKVLDQARKSANIHFPADEGDPAERIISNYTSKR